MSGTALSQASLVNAYYLYSMWPCRHIGFLPEEGCNVFFLEDENSDRIMRISHVYSTIPGIADCIRHGNPDDLNERLYQRSFPALAEQEDGSYQLTISEIAENVRFAQQLVVRRSDDGEEVGFLRESEISTRIETFLPAGNYTRIAVNPIVYEYPLRYDNRGMITAHVSKDAWEISIVPRDSSTCARVMAVLGTSFKSLFCCRDFRGISDNYVFLAVLGSNEPAHQEALKLAIERRSSIQIYIPKDFSPPIIQVRPDMTLQRIATGESCTLL